MPVFQYDLDTTGSDSANRVNREVHALVEEQNIRAIAPIAGAFFVDSLIIFSVDENRILEPESDYVVSQLYESLSIKYLQSIAGMIIITNQFLVGDLEISYQTLGGPYSQSETELAAFITNNASNRLDAQDWINSHAPTTFVPDTTVHMLGNEISFEYVNYAIEKIRMALNGTDMPAIAYIEQYIAEFKASVTDFIANYIDNNLKAEINKQFEFFTKETIRLENIINYLPATEMDGRQYGNESYQLKQTSGNRYIITSALMGFKEVLYNAFISSSITGIDRYMGVVAVPTINTMAIMTNGTRYVIDSLAFSQLNKIPYDLQVYPNPSDADAKWILYKLTNQITSKDGVFFAFNIRTSETYTGILTDTDKVQPNINWIKQLTRYDREQYVSQVVEHVNDNQNPHKTNKFHVRLGNVENYPIVKREDVVCRKPVRKYVTHDALILFWKLYLNGIKTMDDDPDPNDDMDVAERFRLIFAPCGPCGTDGVMPEKPEPIKNPGIEPRGKLLAVWCVRYDKYGRYSDGFGGSYEDLIEEKSVDCKYHGPVEVNERGDFLSSYCEGSTKYARYADGHGSFYIGIMEENSADCGAQSIVDFSLVEIRDDEGTLHGYGFSSLKDPPDVAADVLLQTDEGENICYIFSQPKTSTVGGLSATMEITDSDDNVVGYAIVAE